MTTAFVKVVPDHLSVGIHRVAKALAAAAPAYKVEIVDDAVNADLVVQHVIGWGSLEGWAIKPGQKRAVIQYCLRTTEDPSPTRWAEEWKQAALVASYYDLAAYAPGHAFAFYHAPLGADASVFKPDPIPRALFQCVTSGYVADTESAGEVAEAARRVQGRVFHLGPDLGLGKHVWALRGISDSLLAELYAGSRYVSGLRRIEGFELPAVEGLLCGARPIMFDTPDYRTWFDGFASFVPECPPAELVEHLVKLFQSRLDPMDPGVRRQAVNRFSWDAFAGGFWERVL